MFKFISTCLCINYAFFVNSHEFQIMPSPVSVNQNSGQYSLINSVDFHPKENLFCVTYTLSDKVILYALDTEGRANMVQTLSNNRASRLSKPQHAVFSPDGELLVIVNWRNQTLNIHQQLRNGLYSARPSDIIHPVDELKNYRPHGIAFSPDGNFLAIAYGASSDYGRALGLFKKVKSNKFELINTLMDAEISGTPKGIAFSPDGRALLVTYSDVNSLVIYDFDSINKKILPTPRQVVDGMETGIFRPEDVKITPDGKYCVLSNSEKHTVTFYSFDSSSNVVLANTPYFTLKNPEAQLCFPHGIAFSPDGCFMVITEFGNIQFTEVGSIECEGLTPDQAKFHVYKTKF